MTTPIRKKIHLLIIDPQNDFAASGNGETRQGSLFVPGADMDMLRLANLIDRIGPKLADIHVTLDSHHLLHIANPGMWKNSHGDHPAPFTQITSKDVMNGVWTTRIASHADRALKYLQQLESTQRYSHTIWPPHCLIGEWGHGVVPVVADALRRWCDERIALVDFVTKGSNPFTEHFSAVQAEVPDPKDPSSQINTRLIDTLESADEIVIAGEALSHCVGSSLLDVAKAFKDASFIKKMILLKDCASPVPGFEKQGDAIVQEMVAKGLVVTTSDNYLI